MNPYEVLGVESTAEPAVIKKAYRKLAAKHHPDRAGGDAERFKEVQAAYECLSDPDRRRRYDETGDSGSPQVAPPDPTIQFLHTLLQQAMAQINTDRVHLIQAMRDAIQIKRSEFDAQRHAIRVQREKLERAMKRVKKKSGDNRIAAMLQGWINHIPEQEAALANNMSICDDLLVQLVDYDYELPAELTAQVVNPVVNYTQELGGLTGLFS